MLGKTRIHFNGWQDRCLWLNGIICVINLYIPNTPFQHNQIFPLYFYRNSINSYNIIILKSYTTYLLTMIGFHKHLYLTLM